MKHFITVCLLCLFTLSACGSTAPAPSATAITPVFAFTETVVGPNRLPIGIIKAGTPINDPQAIVTLRFFNLDVDSKTAVGDATATYYGKGLPAAVYVANFTFPSAGNWGVEINVQLVGMTKPTSTKLQLPVSERAIAPKVGDKAIAVDTL
ncbi:MAG: thioredoxin family protein, partial [Chloroflexia bacterium]|nr:thioredoxin family protein [Chloroflexia bacterium]